jgi:hypothetical protein
MSASYGRTPFPEEPKPSQGVRQAAQSRARRPHAVAPSATFRGLAVWVRTGGQGTFLKKMSLSVPQQSGGHVPLFGALCPLVPLRFDNPNEIVPNPNISVILEPLPDTLPGCFEGFLAVPRS